MNALRPLSDRVVIEPTPAESTSAGGVILPEFAQEAPQRGRVRAVGPGAWKDGQRVPVAVDVGDEVLYSKYGGTEITIDGDTCLLIREADLLAVYSKANDRSVQ